MVRSIALLAIVAALLTGASVSAWAQPRPVGGGGGGGGGSLDRPFDPNSQINEFTDILEQIDRQSGDQQQGGGIDAIPDQICAAFLPSQPPQVGADFAEDLDMEVLGSYRMRGLNLQVFLFRVKNPAALEATLKRAGEDGRPLWVQRNQRFVSLQDTASMGGSPNKQYALERIHASALPQGADGHGITLALIDSGVDARHEALINTDIAEIDLIAGGAAPPAEIHGTVMAGIIAGTGKLRGIAPGLKLLALRAFAQRDPKSGGAESNSFLLSLGINTALERGAKVISLSLGGPKDRLVGEIISQALMEGAVVVAAAGNTGPDGDPVYPAAQDGVIAVTATDAKDRLYRHATHGGYISVAAPGVDIVAATPGNAYSYFSGTSMATGYVAGLAAILLAQSPSLNAVTLRKALETTAQDLGAPKKDPEFGWGRIDAAQAYAATRRIGAAN